MSENYNTYLPLPGDTERILLVKILHVLNNGGGGGGGGGTIQVINGNSADPNAASILPAAPTQGAIYKQDPATGFTNLWFWSPSTSQWYQFSS